MLYIIATCAVLRRWGVEPALHVQPPPPLSDSGLDMARYEAERPSEQMAARGGDARFWHPTARS